MRIESNSVPFAPTTVSSRTPARESRVEQDNSSMTSSNNLKHALEQTPTVRADKVAAAKALLADGSYPSEAMLGKVADLLAEHLQAAEG